MDKIIARARRFKRAPIEQIAYEAWTAHVFDGLSEEAFLRADADHRAVKEGRASPLPQYRDVPRLGKEK